MIAPQMDVFGTFMPRDLRSRTIGWCLPVSSLEDPLDHEAECIVEDLQASYIRWGKSTGSLRKDIDKHAEKIANSRPWEELVTIVDSRAYG